jgi:hypothetical protein
MCRRGRAPSDTCGEAEASSIILKIWKMVILPTEAFLGLVLILLLYRR